MSANNNVVKYTAKGRYKDEFEERELLGKGSFGKVYKVFNQKEQRFYAMKKINFKALSFKRATDQLSEDFLKEIRVMLDLKSDYVVNYITSWCENESFFYIQMELCYKALDEVLEQIQIEFDRKPSEKMTPFEYFVSNDLFKELVEALNYLHKKNPPIIHRDLKLQNILITDGKNRRFIKLADFGLAVIHEFKDQTHTQDRGTSKYMAPEVQNSRKYDTRADVYSLGFIAKHLFDIKSAVVPQGVLLAERYENVENLVEKMTSEDNQERPNCQQILNSEKLWYLNIGDLSKDQDFENIINSGVAQSIEDCFYKYFIHKKLEEYSIDHLTKFESLSCSDNFLSKVSSLEHQKLVQTLVNEDRIKSNRVKSVLMMVDRKYFCSDPHTDGAKTIGFGSTISAPHIHSTLLEILENHLKNDSVVLDIGSGSGYLTICMAIMAGLGNVKVIGIDHVKQLIEKSRENLKENFTYLSNKIDFLVSEGRNGYSKSGPYDAINIGGAVDRVPKTILDQLKIGGRLVAPVGPIGGVQELIYIDKIGDSTFEKKTVLPKVVFGGLKDLKS